MTDTPIADQAGAAVHGTGPQHAMPAQGAHAAPQRTFAAEAHHIMNGAWHAIGRFLPFMERAALDPQVDEGIELLMQAAGLGAEARELEPALVLLRHIVAVKQADSATSQQPQFATGGPIAAPGAPPDAVPFGHLPGTQFLPAPVTDGAHDGTM